MSGSSDGRWVTTVIPTFDRARLLERAVRSVLSQSYPLVRVSVFDNVSSDDTPEVMRRLVAEAPGRVLYTRNPVNVGPLQNFNLGIKGVDTPFFSVMSDDDVLLPRFVEEAFQSLDAHPGADIACGLTWAITEDGTVLNGVPLEFPMGYLPAPAGGLAMLELRHPDWQGMLFRRSVVESSGGLDANVPAFDVEFVVRAASKHGIVFYPKHAALFLRHAGSATDNLALKYIYPTWPRTLQALLKDPQVPQSLKDQASQIIPAKLARELKRYLIREMLAPVPRELDAAAGALMETADTPGNRRLVGISRLLSRSSALRALGRKALIARQGLMRKKDTASLDLPDFGPFLRHD